MKKLIVCMLIAVPIFSSEWYYRKVKVVVKPTGYEFQYGNTLYESFVECKNNLKLNEFCQREGVYSEEEN